MDVLNAEASARYMDSLVDEREDSAVSVIHGAWLEHSSSLRLGHHLEPRSPLDMLVLYQAAAETFRDWSPDHSPDLALAQGGRVINRDQAERVLRSLLDQDLAALAVRFVNRAIALSASSSAPQDLSYYLELFLDSVQDKGVVEAIMSGSISSDAKRLTDPNFW
jgi:hypothetical protein